MAAQKQAKSLEKGEYVIGIALVLSALLVSLTLYLSANSLQQGMTRLGTNIAAQAQTAAMANAPSQAAAGVLAFEKEVTMDFLYADWCPHCQKMKPIVAALEQALPKDRFIVRYYRDEDSQTNATVASVYSKYSNDGYFSGFPTFVINGADYKSGAMEESEFKAWVCGKFASPKPAGC